MSLEIGNEKNNGENRFRLQSLVEAFRFALNVTRLDYSADYFAVTKASGYGSFLASWIALAVSTILSINMRMILHAAAIIYLAQAATGFVVGLTLPWLQFFGVL